MHPASLQKAFKVALGKAVGAPGQPGIECSSPSVGFLKYHCYRKSCHPPVFGRQLCRDPGTGTMREGNIGREGALFCRYAYSPERAAG
jgi:hypothetical protein